MAKPVGHCREECWHFQCEDRAAQQRCVWISSSQASTSAADHEQTCPKCRVEYWDHTQNACFGRGIGFGRVDQHCKGWSRLYSKFWQERLGESYYPGQWPMVELELSDRQHTRCQIFGVLKGSGLRRPALHIPVSMPTLEKDRAG